MNLNGLCSPFLLCTCQLKLVTQPQPDPKHKAALNYIEKKRKREYYAFRGQFNEKPSIVLGCPGDKIDNLNRQRSHQPSQDSSKSSR